MEKDNLKFQNNIQVFWFQIRRSWRINTKVLFTVILIYSLQVACNDLVISGYEGFFNDLKNINLSFQQTEFTFFLNIHPEDFLIYFILYSMLFFYFDNKDIKASISSDFIFCITEPTFIRSIRYFFLLIFAFLIFLFISFFIEESDSVYVVVNLSLPFWMRLLYSLFATFGWTGYYLIEKKKILSLSYQIIPFHKYHKFEKKPHFQYMFSIISQLGFFTILTLFLISRDYLFLYTSFSLVCGSIFGLIPYKFWAIPGIKALKKIGSGESWLVKLLNKLYETLPLFFDPPKTPQESRLSKRARISAHSLAYLLERNSSLTPEYIKDVTRI